MAIGVGNGQIPTGLHPTGISSVPSTPSMGSFVVNWLVKVQPEYISLVTIQTRERFERPALKYARR